jgi:spore cortex formation protein SpoVR/YcgB (stage V sporulation)
MTKMSIDTKCEEMIAIAKKLGIAEYKTEFLIPAVRELLDQCAAIGYSLIQKHQDAPEGFEDIWSDIRKLHESL